MPRPPADGGSFDHVLSRCFRRMGQVAKENMYDDVVSFMNDVARDLPATCFLRATLSTRQNKRSRRALHGLQDDWTAGDRGRGVMEAASTAYGMYCLVRRYAAPTLAQPALDPEGVSHIPRRLQQQLRVRGIVGHTIHSRGTLHTRAMAEHRKAWSALAGNWAVLWVDNYYRRRFVANPAVLSVGPHCHS